MTRHPRKRYLLAAMSVSILCGSLFGLGRSETELDRDGSPPRQDPSTTGPADRREERDALVETYIARRGITDREVLRAMRTVPRHRFLPENLARSAYRDIALPIGYGQTISQPYVVAFMTDALDLHPGEKALEVGTGSGYQAAVLAEIVSEVWSIEIVPELETQVRERLRVLGYGGIKLKEGDGYYGWEAEAPFDKMIVTAAVDHVPMPLLRQLATGGKMILPLGPPGGIQTLLLISKHADGSFERTSLLSVRFVPMTGRAQQ